MKSQHEGKGKSTLLCSCCVASAEGGEENENNPKAEEVISPAAHCRMSRTARLQPDHPCTSASSWLVNPVGLYQTLMLSNTDENDVVG